MPTLELTLRLPPQQHETLVAELSELGYDSFASEGPVLRAYLHFLTEPPKGYAESARGVLGRYGISTSTAFSLHEDTNWNALWEASIRAVKVGRFVVAPDWDVPALAAEDIVLRINPKMSFGTGHHESTRLALRHLEQIVSSGDVVLDAGTGTGILAIAAVKLGARHVVAFDNDPRVAENFADNIQANAVVQRVAFLTGTIEDIEHTAFDIIVANINRAALIESMSQFSRRLAAKGILTVSGLLIEDRTIMVEVAVEADFVVEREIEEGGWWSCSFRRA